MLGLYAGGSSVTTFVDAHIQRLESAKPSPGETAVELFGGPYDGCRVYVAASTVIKLIRMDRCLCVEMDSVITRVAAYQIPSRGRPIHEGLRGYFRGVADLDADPEPVDV